VSEIKSGFYLRNSFPKEKFLRTKLAFGDQIYFDLRSGTVQFNRDGQRLLHGPGKVKDDKFVLAISRSETFSIAKMIALASGMNVQKVHTDKEDFIVYEFIK